MQKVKPFLILLVISLFIGTGHANAFNIGKYDAPLYLTVKSNCENRNGCRLTLSTRTGTRSQEFFKGNAYQKYYNFHEIKTGTGKCLEVRSGCAGKDWCPVQIWNCNGRPEQAWRFYYSSNFPDRNGNTGAYFLKNYVNGKVIQQRCANNWPGTCIIEAFNPTSSPAQGWLYY